MKNLEQSAELARATLHALNPTAIRIWTFVWGAFDHAVELFPTKADAEAAANMLLGTEGLTDEALDEAWSEKREDQFAIEEHLLLAPPRATPVHMVIKPKSGTGHCGYLTVRSGRVLLQSDAEHGLGLASIAGTNAAKLRIDLERASTPDECLSLVRAALIDELEAFIV